MNEEIVKVENKNRHEDVKLKRYISVYLFHCEGRRNDEIANALGISARTVYVQDFLHNNAKIR